MRCKNQNIYDFACSSLYHTTCPLSLYLLISEVILVCDLFCSSQSQVSSCHIHKKEEEAKNKCDVSVPVFHITVSFFFSTCSSFFFMSLLGTKCEGNLFSLLQCVHQRLFNYDVSTEQIIIAGC